jgi:signal transduction histidine kinase
VSFSDLERLAELLRQHREELLARWRDEVRKLPAAQGLDTPTLNDHIPALLDAFASALTSLPDQTIPEAHAAGSPSAHGAQRFRDGFDIEEVVAEYNILRGVVYSLAEEHGIPITGQAFHITNRLLDRAIGLAVQTYAVQRSLDAKKRRDEHLAFVAHDLRTPLNAISLAVRILEHASAGSAEHSEDHARMLRTLRRNVDALQRLVTSVVEENTNLPEAADLRIERRHVDLWPLVEALVDDLNPVAATSGTQLVNAVPEDLGVYADASLLRRVLQNLIANAIKAAPRGHIIVGARTVDKEGSVECWVKDDGTGIATEQLELIAEVFARQDAERASTGLGLAIVTRFVRAHGGTVAVESQQGTGSTFRFTLPGSRIVSGS